MEVHVPHFQCEVGFGNLALGAAAPIAVAGGWSIDALVIVNIGCAIRLAQASILHAQTYSEEGRPAGYLVRSSLPTLSTWS